MSKIEEFKKFREQIRYATCWIAMIGKPYSGGGGGIGGLHGVSVKPDIYYQESNRSKTYHDCPQCLAEELGNVVKRRFPELLAEAMEAMAVTEKRIGQEALAEMQALAEELGLCRDDATHRGLPLTASQFWADKLGLARDDAEGDETR